MRDIFSHHSPAILLAAAALSADNTPVAVDMRGYNSGLVLLSVGVGGITFDGSNKIEFVLKHGDTATVGDHVAVTAGDLILDSLAPATITGGIVRALVAAHAAGTVQKIGYLGQRRYVSLLADFTGTHGAATPVAALMLRGHGHLKP